MFSGVMIETRRRAGLSLIELVLALGALGAGTLFFGAAQVEGLAAGEAGTRHRQAVAIAQDQVDLVSVLPFETLEITDGFVAPFWLRVPGYFDGELPVAENAGAIRVYRVRWSVSEAGDSLRAVEMQVHWTGADGSEKSYSQSALRGRS